MKLARMKLIFLQGNRDHRLSLLLHMLAELTFYGIILFEVIYLIKVRSANPAGIIKIVYGRSCRKRKVNPLRS